MPKTAEKTLIACVGNMLLMDEGFGPYMARVLTDYDTACKHFDEEHARFLASTFREDATDPGDDERICVLDAGTMGMSLLRWLRNYDRMIVIDIVDCKTPDIAPGTVLTLTAEEMAENTVMHSLHDLRVVDVLANAQLAGVDVSCTCICVQAENYEPEDFHIGLTPRVEAAIPTVVGALLGELGLLESE